jgi:succinate dehydrogenase / fumarate reductase membrane anchor subunit
MSKNLTTPLKRVRGNGAAGDGVHHWWAQRLSAVALIPLSLWFLSSLISLMGGGREAVLEWMTSPYAAIAMALFVVVIFYHAFQGLRVIVEDYISCSCGQVMMITALRFAALLLAGAGVLATIKLHLMG